MGASTRRKKAFLLAHPWCCFCGGGVPATEVEHLPSRACFDKRLYPDGFEFPTCHACNASTSSDEQVVALLSRALCNPAIMALPYETQKYMAGVANNNVDVFAEMANGAKRLDSEHGLFGAGEATHRAFQSVLERWAKAFHYKETRTIVPPNGFIYVAWFTAANAHEIPPAAVEGHAHILRRNGKNIGDQFMYVTRNEPVRWSRFVGQVGGQVKVYSGC